MDRRGGSFIFSTLLSLTFLSGLLTVFVLSQSTIQPGSLPRGGNPLLVPEAVVPQVIGEVPAPLQIPFPDLGTVTVALPFSSVIGGGDLPGLPVPPLVPDDDVEDPPRGVVPREGDEDDDPGDDGDDGEPPPGPVNKGHDGPGGHNPKGHGQGHFKAPGDGHAGHTVDPWEPKHRDAGKNAGKNAGKSRATSHKK